MSAPEHAGAGDEPAPEAPPASDAPPEAEPEPAPVRHPATPRAWTILLVTAAVAVAVDQVTKALVRSRLALGETVDVLPGLDVTHTGNEGVSFGLGGSGGRQWLLVVVSIVAIAAMVIHVARSGGRSVLYPLAFGLLVGGAIGNLIDRIAHGAVTDWVALPHFWIFNVADICITLGVVVLALHLLRRTPPAGAAPATPGAEEA